MAKLGDKVLIASSNWKDEVFQGSFAPEYGTVVGFSEKEVMGSYHNSVTLPATEINMEDGSFKKLTCMEAEREDLFTKAEFAYEINNEISSYGRKIDRFQEAINNNEDLLKIVKSEDIRAELTGNIDYYKMGIQTCKDMIGKLEVLAKEIDKDPKLTDPKEWKPNVNNDKEIAKEMTTLKRESADIGR